MVLIMPLHSLVGTQPNVELPYRVYERSGPYLERARGRSLDSTHGIDVLILTETWLHSSPSLRNVLFHSPITSSNYRDGIAVVSRPDLQVSILSHSTHHVSLLVGDVVFIAPYLPPSLSATSFSAFFDNVANFSFSPSGHPTF